MCRYILRRLFIGYGVLLASLSTGWASGNPAGVEVSEVAPGVYVHRGRHSDIEDLQRGDSANIGFVIGEECVAVIDTGGSLATGVALRAAIKEKTSRRICYVINTHVHFDHVLGNAAFLDDAPEFVGHENLRPAMDASREFFVEHFAAELGGNPSGALVIGPSTLVSDHLELHLGNRPLHLAAASTAHTDNDLTIVDVATQTLWTGDLVFIERLPVIDGTLRGWLRWLDETAQQPYARAVPGHGPASAPWPDAAAPLRRYLENLLRATREAIANGVFLEDAVKGVGKASLDGWVLTARAHPRNVSKAYRELEWE